MKTLVVLTGAGISKESGIQTFRDSDGLWENHSIMDVATPQGWDKNPQLVLEFYNDRRKHLQTCEPNEAHKILAELQNDFNVKIITQNVDNLHERAGSKNILHLHGQLTQARKLHDDSIVDIGYKDITMEDHMRPNIVWFGENVLTITDARNIVGEADIFAVIGTSLQVYPAAGLVEYVPHNSTIWVIDPNNVYIGTRRIVNVIHEVATKGTKILKDKLAVSII